MVPERLFPHLPQANRITHSHTLASGFFFGGVGGRREISDYSGENGKKCEEEAKKSEKGSVTKYVGNEEALLRPVCTMQNIASL